MTDFSIDALTDADLFDQENGKIGSIKQVYLDDQTNEPKFITVKTGMFGGNETFVPLADVKQVEDGFQVPFTKDFVKDAPNIDEDGHITPEQERKIFEYYKLDYAAAPAAAAGDAEAGRHAAETPAPANADASAAGDVQVTDDTTDVVAHEERLKVGTQTQASGQARLRKRVVTEHQQVDVPVQREELIVEREKIDPDSPEARNAGTISEDGSFDETVTLREEVPVVGKETVATEKVNVGKRTVTETETVEGDVRREEIDVDVDGDADQANR